MNTIEEKMTLLSLIATHVFKDYTPLEFSEGYKETRK